MNRSLHIVALFACILASACSNDNSTSTTPTPTTQTRIINLSGDLAFGNVNIGDSRDRPYTISNSGNTPLTITGLQAVGGTGSTGFAATITTGTVGAGSSLSGMLRFTPTASSCRAFLLRRQHQRPHRIRIRIRRQIQARDSAPSAMTARPARLQAAGHAHHMVACAAGVTRTVRAPTHDRLSLRFGESPVGPMRSYRAPCRSTRERRGAPRGGRGSRRASPQSTALGAARSGGLDRRHAPRRADNPARRSPAAGYSSREISSSR